MLILKLLIHVLQRLFVHETRIGVGLLIDETLMSSWRACCLFLFQIYIVTENDILKYTYSLSPKQVAARSGAILGFVKLFE